MATTENPQTSKDRALGTYSHGYKAPPAPTTAEQWKFVSESLRTIKYCLMILTAIALVGVVAGLMALGENA